MPTEKVANKRILGFTGTHWTLIVSVLVAVVVIYGYLTWHKHEVAAAAQSSLAAEKAKSAWLAHKTPVSNPPGAQTGTTSAYLANLGAGDKAEPVRFAIPTAREGSSKPPGTTAPTQASLVGPSELPGITTAVPVASALAPTRVGLAGLAELSGITTAPPATSALAVRAATQAVALKALKVEQSKVVTLKAKVTSLEKRVSAKKQERVVAENMRLVRENKKLHHELADVHKSTAAMKHRLARRPALPGWSVIATNGRAAALAGPNGAVRLVHTGETVMGVRILGIDDRTGDVRTSAGVLKAGA